jgi:glycosyltransferase involved in cell wall biosynthesis
MDKLYIVIPAYNEELNIVNVAKEWHAIVQDINKQSRLVVIDDGSRDSTYKTLNNLKNSLPQLITISRENSGHGATVLFGYHYALNNGADYVFQTDSDGQTIPSEFWQFWENRNEYPVQIGYRKNRKDGLSRIVVTKILKLVLWSIFKTSVTDANTPFRLMDAGVLKKYIGMIPENFNLSNIILTMLFVKFGEKIKFREITFKARQGGINSINIKKIIQIGLKAVKDFKKIKKAINE